MDFRASLGRQSRRLGIIGTMLLGLVGQRVWSQPIPAADGAERTAMLRARATPVANPNLPPEAAAIIEGIKYRQATAQAELDAAIARARQEVIDRLQVIAGDLERSGAADKAQAVRQAIAELRAQTPGDVLPDPGNLMQYRGKVGQQFRFSVVGQTMGTVWGSGIYTDDSPLATAAVHAGLLREGQSGIIRVTIQPPLPSYEGTQQNGVGSFEYGPWGGSYTVGPNRPAVKTGPYLEIPESLIEPRSSRPAVDLSDGSVTLPSTPTGPAMTADRVDSALPQGAHYDVEVTGSTSGRVWGDGVYTTDSSLSTAAVHAGVLGDGEKGMVTVTILAGQPAYEGSTRHGVTTSAWNSWDKSFRVEKAIGGASGRGVDR